LRLTVISPFLDRHHGTESCIIEQIERLAFTYDWEIHIYSQHVDEVQGLRVSTAPVGNARRTIVWHKVSDILGPHLLKYVWWFFANQLQRWGDRQSGKTKAHLIYSPGVNSLDADAIVVHIVFHEFFSQLRADLQLRLFPLKSWHLIIHRKLYYKLAMLLENRVYRNPRVRLAAVSSLVANHLKSHFKRTDVTVIPNAVDTVRFTPDTRLAKRYTTRQTFGYFDDDFVMLLIGNDWKHKGLDFLLKAFDLLRDLPLRLLVVGSDDPSFYQEQLAEIASPERVRFETPTADVLSFYAAADAYVAPSLGDSFGLPILEAMACGLPVVASIHAGASELIQDGETGLLLSDPRDPSEIACLIKRLFTDGSLRRKMGHAASRYAHANCGWDQNVSKTRDFLEATFRRLQEEQPDSLFP
jgi:glycosyltransferase involved in cell wall biosynthesis